MAIGHKQYISNPEVSEHILFQDILIFGKSQAEYLLYSERYIQPYPDTPIFQEIWEKDPGTKGTVTAEKENPADRIAFILARSFFYKITLYIFCSDERTDRWRKSHHTPYPR